MRDQSEPDYRTGDTAPSWSYPPVNPEVTYGPHRGALDWNVRWPGLPAEEFLRVLVGARADGTPVALDLRGSHVLCTGGDRAAFLRTVLVGLADRFSPDLVQFLVATSDDTLEGMPSVPHAATVVMGKGPQLERPRGLARAIDWEIWRRGTLSEEDLAREPALVLAFGEVDRLLTTESELRDVLDAIGRDGARLRMHLLMTADDPSVPNGLPCLPVSVQDGHGSLGAQPFRLVAITPGQLLEFADTFTYYNHPVRSLWQPPGGVTYERMMACDQGVGKGIPVGVVGDGRFGVRRLDFAERSHLMVHGQPGCGKTTVLRTLLRGLAASDAVVLGLDQVGPVVDRVRDVLRQRLADPTAWEGPELFLVADDYDTVPVDADPLEPLADLLRHGSSIGVHLLAAGTGQMDHRPVIRALADRTVILLSGREAQANRWDTVASRFGRQTHDLKPFPAPVGQAWIDGHRTTVQIAVDTGPPPELRPVTDLFTSAAEGGTENLYAVIGVAEGGEPVRLDVRGHTWCGGDTGSGRSTMVRRVAFSLAAKYSPTTVQLLAAEFDADRLADVAHLPNTAGYVAMSHPGHAHRFAALLDDELRRRLWLEEEGELSALPQLVVLVDGVGEFVAAAPAAGDALRRVAAVGGRLGISLVLTQRSLVGPAVLDLHRMMNVRMSLAYWSGLDVARTLGVSEVDPLEGRGAAFLRVGDRAPRSFRLTEVVPTEVYLARFRARGPAVRARPLSPPLGTFTYDELSYLVATQPEETSGVPLGLSGEVRRPIGVDFDREPHVMVIGTPGSGRSTVLRTLLRGVARHYTARECAILLLHDNMIEGVVPKEHVLATSAGLEPSATMIDEVLTALRKRVGKPEQTGPRVFVAIDDLDLFAAEHDPLTAMRDLIPHAREIGLHVLVTGGRDILGHPEVGALGAPAVSLYEGRLPASTAGDVPALPTVGHGVLEPGGWPVRLPWCQRPEPQHTGW